MGHMSTYAADWTALESHPTHKRPLFPVRPSQPSRFREVLSFRHVFPFDNIRRAAMFA